MKNSKWMVMPFFVSLISLGPGPKVAAPFAQVNLSVKLWYAEPARASVADVKEGWENDAEWLKALPVGNGFLGAMVFGDVNRERLQLNEKSLWSGGPDDNDNPEAYASLAEIRRLLFEGKYKEATALTLKTQVCKGAGSGHGNGALSFKLALTRPKRYETRAVENHLQMTGTMNNGKGGQGLRYAARLKAVATGGRATCSDAGLFEEFDPRRGDVGRI